MMRRFSRPIHRLGTLVVALAMLCAAGLVAASPASASTTKCNGNLCVHVQGTGLHVDYIQYYVSVSRGKTFKGYFGVNSGNGGTSNHKFYERITHNYSFHTPAYYVAPHKFATGKWTVNKTFENNTRLAIFSRASGFDCDLNSVVIHR